MGTPDETHRLELFKMINSITNKCNLLKPSTFQLYSNETNMYQWKEKLFNFFTVYKGLFQCCMHRLKDSGNKMTADGILHPAKFERLAVVTVPVQRAFERKYIVQPPNASNHSRRM